MHGGLPPDARAVAHGDRGRFFIITHGRTGSTLLAAMLADCGAEFAMPAPADWRVNEGDLEHPDIQTAARWLSIAYAIGPEKPPVGWRRYAWSAYRARGKQRLRAALMKARYLKCVNLDLGVYPAFQFGYHPSIILSYRRFEDAAISESLNSGNSDLSLLARRYNRTYRNGLLQLSTFGGCAIGFEQLIDLEDTSWVNPLAKVTGLAPARLVEARARRLKSLGHAVASPKTMDRSARDTFEQVHALCGAVVVPSAPALRFLRAETAVRLGT